MSTALVKNRRKLLKVTLASLSGTMLEFYDHFIYGTAAAIVFPTVFFSDLDPHLALVLSLIIYGVAFVSRPLGALIFGHYGDIVGRKKILVMVLLLMGGATFLIGCLPSYQTAGVFGAIALVCLRTIQGIALGGEWGGAALMVNEYTKGSKHQGLLGSIVQLASPLGFLLASGVFAIVTYCSTPEQLLSLTWRYPFFASAILVILGVYIRGQIDESPEFEKLKTDKDLKSHNPIKEVIRYHWKNLLLAIGTRIGSDALFYVFALFPLVFLPAIGVDRQIALNASILASVGQACGIPLFGWLSDRYSTKKVLAGGAVLNFVWLIVFFELLQSKNELAIYFASYSGLFCLAALWAPLATHFPKMFPVEVRFTGAGVGFQAAGILGGAIAPTICIFLLTSFANSPIGVIAYMGALLALIFVCVVKTKEY
mgnify:FL=1